MILTYLHATETCGKKSEKRNAIRQGIISNDSCTENCMKLRINALDKNSSNKQDKAISNTYGNKFVIPFDFEMLDSALPYYQAGLRNRLCYELKFNDYNRVIKSAVPPPDAKYKITDIFRISDCYSAYPCKIYFRGISKHGFVIRLISQTQTIVEKTILYSL